LADRQLIIRANTYPKICRIRPRRIVNPEYHKVREAIGVEVGHGDARAGVLVGEPIWDG